MEGLQSEICNSIPGSKMSRYFTRTHILLAAIVFVAAFFRLYRLDQIPPGFQFDQAFYVFDALKLLQGEFAIFFFQPGRSEPLYQYLVMVGVALFGADTPLGLKLTGVAIGVLTIPLVYGITRMMFQSTRVALLAALFAAMSLWHIFYSRYGERIPLTLFMAILTFSFLWRALDPSPVEDGAQAGQGWGSKWRYFVLTGLFTGLTLYTYPSGRVVPVAVVLLTAYAMLTDRTRARDYLKGLLLIVAIATIVFLPLGIYYLQHPLDFFSHTTEVSIFVPHGAVTANVPLELGKNAIRILGMFFVVGDSGVLRNLPYRPIFDPLLGALFCVGVLVWLSELVSRKTTRAQRLRAMFLLVWLGLATGLSLISDDAPNNGRILIGFPVVMILPAWGASAIWERLRAPIARRAAMVMMGGIVAISALLVYHDYFIVLANDPGTYYAFDTDKVETANWLNQNALSSHLYVAPLWYQNGTISLLTRNALLKSFESRDTVVLPSRVDGRDALFAFPWEQEKKTQTLVTRLGALGALEIVRGSNDGTLLLVYRVPAKNLPDLRDPLATLAHAGDFAKPQNALRAAWNDQFELLGYSVDAADAAQRNLEVTLFFHALKPMTEDYTFSVKVRDALDRVWGQEDKWLGDNSYATTQMGVGDLVIEKFYPGLNACAPAGEYRITVEAYNPKTSQVLGLSDRDGTTVMLGSTHADASPSNRLEDLEPEQTVDVKIGERLQLIGYTLMPHETRAGEPFSLALFWRGAGQGSTEPIGIRLQDATKRDVTLAQSDIIIPGVGRGLCTLFDLRAPSDAAIGAATIFANDSKITTLNVIR